MKCFLIFILIGYNSSYYPLIGPYLRSAGLVAPSYCSIEKPDMAWARGTWCGVRPWGEKRRVNALCQGHRPPPGCLLASLGWISARFQTGNKTEPFICVSPKPHQRSKWWWVQLFLSLRMMCTHSWQSTSVFAENFREKSGRMDNIYFLIFYDRGNISCSRSSRANECGVNVEVREHSRNFLPVRQTKLTTRWDSGE